MSRLTKFEAARGRWLALALLGGAAAAHAQHNGMPGMDMPMAPQPQKPAARPRPSAAPARKPAAPAQQTPTPAPTTMQMPDGTTMPAHAMPGMGDTPGSAQSGQPGSGDFPSTSRDVLALQEPENVGFNTGNNLPVPELLVHAASLPAMSVEDFVALSERNNPTLREAEAVVERTRQQARQQGLPPNPTLGYSGEHIRGGQYNGGEQGAYVAQEFVLGGKLGLRRKVFEGEQRSDELGLREQHFRVRAGVEGQFYDALTAQATVVVRQRLLQVAEDAAETAHQLANLGQADAPDVLQAEVEAEQARVDYLHAQRAYLAQWSMLAAVAGSPGLAPAPLRGSLQTPPELDADAAVANILTESPTLERARQDVATAEARVRNARREAVPNLTVRAGEWYSGETIDSSRQQAGPMSFADAGLTIPLFNRNQGNAEAARAELGRARGNVSRTELDLRRMAEPVAQEYRAAQFEADRYRTSLLPRAKRAYELYVTKYQQMASAYPQVLVSQRTLFQLQIAYLNALDRQWQSAIELRNYVLRDGLMEPRATGPNDTMMNLPNR